MPGVASQALPLRAPPQRLPASSCSPGAGRGPAGGVGSPSLAQVKIPAQGLAEGLAAAWGRSGGGLAPASFPLQRLVELPSEPTWRPVKGSACGPAGLEL